MTRILQYRFVEALEMGLAGEEAFDPPACTCTAATRDEMLGTTAATWGCS